jgi:hypothetical protein
VPIAGIWGLWLILRRIWRALRSTFNLLTNREVMRALPWPYIRRLPRRNAWIGILTATVALSLPLALLGIALPGEAGVGFAGMSVLVALAGLASSGVRAVARNRWLDR